MTKTAPVVLALLAACVSAPLAAQESGGLDDPTIVAIFDIANSADVETGRLAQERGESPKVREMGKNFAEAHTQVRQMGRDLAKKLGVTPTPPADSAMLEEHQAAMTRLQSLRGEAFDRAYLEHEEAYHQAVIDAVTETLLPAIQNEELKALVEKVAPAFQSHLAAIKALRAELGH